jgi:hypothetical protein
MTLAALRAEVRRRVLEVAGAPVFYTDADIDVALNSAYAELSDSSEWYETWQDIDLLNNRPYYDARTLLGDALLAPGAAFNRTTNRWLLPTSIGELDRHDRRWERVVGTPSRIIVRGLWWLSYWPRVQAATGTIKQYFTALPPALVNDTDEPGFPETFHNALVDGALVDLFSQDAEATWALTAWATYLKTEADLIQWVSERASSAAIHGFGGTAGVSR